MEPFPFGEGGRVLSTTNAWGIVAQAESPSAQHAESTHQMEAGLQRNRYTPGMDARCCTYASGPLMFWMLSVENHKGGGVP